MIGMRDATPQRSIINVLGSSMQNTTVIFIVRLYLSSPSAGLIRFLTSKSHKAGSKGAWLEVCMDFGYSFVMPYFSRISKATKRKEM